MPSRYSIALEMQDDLGKWIRSEAGSTYVDVFCRDYNAVTLGGLIAPQKVQRTTKAYKAVVHTVFNNAEPYYWSNDMCDLLMIAAKSLPEWKLELEYLPSQHGFMWFSKHLPMTLAPFTPHPNVRDISLTIEEMERINSTEEPLTGIGWVSSTNIEGKKFVIILNIVKDAISGRYAGVPSGLASWGQGETVTDVWINQIGAVQEDTNDPQHHVFDSPEWEERYIEVLRYFGAAMLLLNQKVFTAQKQAPDRLARKRVAKPRPINVLYLRRKINVSSNTPSDRIIEWSHRWFVSGHWRQQWYPSVKQNRPLWIMPYVKGPEDLPLQMPSPKVFAMVR